MYHLPTWVEIDLDALTDNLGAIRDALFGDSRVLLTVKADAYGHGAVQIAKAAEHSVEMFGVATIDEALELVAVDVRRKILILSPILGEEIPAVVEHGLLTTISSLDFARHLSDYSAANGARTEVHIEVDTGMGRTGFLPREAEALVHDVVSLPGLRLGGLMSHFPVSDSDVSFTRDQVRQFRAVVERLEQQGIVVDVVHSANSAAIPTVPESHLGMVRPGLLAYGHLPGNAARTLPVTPVLAWKSRLVQIRRVPAGTTISYGMDHTTTRETVLGVLPVGYGHGYPFRLSSRGQVIVNGKAVPILGRVTMDMTMVDLTDVRPAPAVGDEVVLIGRDGGAVISVEQVATWAGTLSYEILTGISKRVPRAYKRGGQVESVKSLLGIVPYDMGV
jgi:alanine racemase